MHPLDWEKESVSLGMLYLGAAGVMWSLNHLARVGMLDVPAPDFADVWPELLGANRRFVSAFSHGTDSLWMGDAGILLATWLDDPSESVADALEQAIDRNRTNPALEFMWGASGTLLAAVVMHERTGEERWAVRFRESAAAMWNALERDEQLGCLLWTQNLYGTRSRHVGAGHGFAGNVYPVIRGRHLLSASDRAKWQSCIEQTVLATVVRVEGQANWTQSVGTPRPGRTELLVQYCHGAPGIICCLASLPSETIRSLLLEAGELTWTAGPLTKGAGLCHGTAGNGYALLKLFTLTGDEVWLDRARAFAMHAIGQYRKQRREYRRGRYSLWTGDQGLSLYLSSCIVVDDRFPTIDVF